MPFGLCNAPATLQRPMEKVLGTLIIFRVFVYIDDGLINAESPEQLIEILSTVLKLLAKAELKCNPLKCLLITQRISSSAASFPGTASTPTRPSSIEFDNGRSQTKTELAPFLGRCNYY